MKLWGICGFCARFPGRKGYTPGCPVKKRPDGKWHSNDFQGIAKCPMFIEKRNNKVNVQRTN